jgi:hypothetical protein
MYLWLIHGGRVKWAQLVCWPLLGLLYQPWMIDKYDGAVSGMRIGRGNWSTWRKLPQCHFFHPLMTWPGVTPRHSGKPATSHLKHYAYPEYVFWKVQEIQKGLEWDDLNQLLVCVDNFNLWGENVNTIKTKGDIPYGIQESGLKLNMNTFQCHGIKSKSATSCTITVYKRAPPVEALAPPPWIFKKREKLKTKVYQALIPENIIFFFFWIL